MEFRESLIVFSRMSYLPVRIGRLFNLAAFNEEIANKIERPLVGPSLVAWLPPGAHVRALQSAMARRRFA